MRKKKSTQQLVGIESVTDSSVLTTGGELTFYLVQPTNLNVLPESGVRTRVTALLNVLKTSAEMELLALDSKESYQDMMTCDCELRLLGECLPREELVFLLEQDRPLEQMSKAWMEHRNVDVGETFQSLLTGLYAEQQHDMDMKM